jgi:chromosome segregation ATPase
MARSINSRLLEIERASENTSSTREVEKYKQFIRKYEEEAQHFEQGRLAVQEQEIEKLEKIIEIRNIQISNNEESYFKLKHKLEEVERELGRHRLKVKELKKSSTHANELEQQVRQLSEDSRHGRLKEVGELKDKNAQLERELATLQNNLRGSEHKLHLAHQQVDKLQFELRRWLEYHSQSIDRLGTMEVEGSEKEQLTNRVYDLEDELDAVTGQLREM